MSVPLRSPRTLPAVPNLEQQKKQPASPEEREPTTQSRSSAAETTPGLPRCRCRVPTPGWPCTCAPSSP